MVLKIEPYAFALKDNTNNPAAMLKFQQKFLNYVLFQTHSNEILDSAIRIIEGRSKGVDDLKAEGMLWPVITYIAARGCHNTAI